MAGPCGVCNIQSAKYKCPSCQLQYCSTQCYKPHQANHPNNLPPKPPPPAFTNPVKSYVEIGRPCLEANPLLSLEISPDLQLLYKRFPRLHHQLRRVYEATNEPPADYTDEFSSGRHAGDRRRGYGRGRGRSRDRGIGAPWSQQKGFKAGLYLMRKLRHLKGLDGKGLMEFSQLITRTIGNKSSEVASAGV
ncbi:hypothetical protein N7G274_000790 [Stereocaulon virgatum]|uniref:HIT-type domain-containing protein n=1 Tax=Stereocaulon virgatum TaxID=373712 RepID=A0ABR4APV9_9LECA